MDMRQLINIVEGRLPDVDYEETANKVIASLKSYESQSYTKLAQKIEKINELSKEINTLKAEVKQETRERIAGIFDAEDVVNTRVVETIQFIFTLSKDPAATVSPKYKDILSALEKQLTPELIVVLNQLKETMVTVTQKEPSLKLTQKENVGQPIDQQILQLATQWGAKYDKQLDALEQSANIR